MPHRWLWALLAIAVVVSPGGAALGQDVQWSVSVGFGDAYREGAWTPVFVDIANQGESRVGQVAIPEEYRSSYPGTSPRTISYAAPVELPRNSRKRYILYAPSESLEEVLLSLPGTLLRAKVPPARAAGKDDALLVVVGGEPGLLSFLNGTPVLAPLAPQRRLSAELEAYWSGPRASARGGGKIIVGHVRWDALPDSWIGWEGVDAVVLGDANSVAASPEATGALLQWVRLGGVLIVPGGAAGPEIVAGPLREMLPIRFGGTTTLPGLAELGRWAEHPITDQPLVAVIGRLAPGATVLCGTDSQPLIASVPVGSGRVVMTAFDYGAAPVKYWDGQTAMWPKIIAAAPGSRPLAEQWQAAPQGYSDLTLADAASYTPSARVPPLWFLLGFLGAYIVVLVPVNYHVLKRLDRRELAWVTTPAIIAIFTLAAYAAGYQFRGVDVVLNRLGIIEASSGEPIARGRGYIGLFSPSRTTFELLLQGTSAGAREVTPADQRVRAPAVVTYGPTPRIANVAMNMWTTRAFCVDFVADLGGGISGKAEFDGHALSATVTNNSSLDLKNCRLVQADRAGSAKALKAGGKAELSLSSAHPIGDRNRWGDFRAYEHMETPDVITDIATRVLLGNPTSSPGLTAANTAAYLLGSANEPLVPVALDQHRPRTNDCNLVIVRLPVQLAAKRAMSVPQALIDRRVASFSGTLTPRPDVQPGAFAISDGGALIEFRVPFGEDGGTAQKLVLRTSLLVEPNSTASPSAPPAGRVGRGQGRRTGGAPVPTAPSPGSPAAGATSPPLAEVAVYDFVRDRWDVLLSTRVQAQNSVGVPSPANHMSPDGRALVRVRAQSASVTVESCDLVAGVKTF